MACALLIVFHVNEELNYDKGFSKANRIYRITLKESGENARHWAATSPVLKQELKSFYSEVQDVVRMHRPYPYQLLSYKPAQGEAKRFEERGGFFADTGIVSMFDLQFLHGDAATALEDMDAIVLSEEMANRYFGNEDPVGKVMQDDARKVALKVTGVVKTIPYATHLRFDYLLSMPTITRHQDEAQMRNRSWSGFYTYVLLKEVAAKKTVDARLKDFLVSVYTPTGETKEQVLSTRRFVLQPIGDIHLHSKLEKEMSSNSDITYVYIFSIAALFILLVAAVNFINISTALAFGRMKEIGLRKVVGAERPQLIRQFLGESFLVTLLATMLAFVLLQAAIPFYNNVSANQFHFNDLFILSNLAGIVLLVVALGLMAGLYPAWFVARFNPITSLKGKRDTGSSVHLVRKGLIVFQFVVSVFMIFSTIIVYRQLQLFHKKDLGFDKEQVLAVTIYGNMWEPWLQ